ncbi:zinc finger protein 521-like [Brachionus plicatilis]|uniref:Zinc finger protein 521-like n=1 Tax=Brachionus plicatilis TaxID=10195 RepID=A0A3M7SW86_BRAPC|nr:zinc finger protein 521-like [Brachionus plicatilis]
MDYAMEATRAINPANSVSTNEDSDEEELFDEDEEVPMQQRAAKTRRKQVKPVRILNDKPEAASGALKLQCGFCASQCDDLNTLKNHLYKDHIEQILNHLVSQSAQPKSHLSAHKLETFCTICKKEVCNKYFLKSHLLNKHGVQLEDYLASNTSSEPAQPSSQAALYAAAVANELIENHAQHLTMATLDQAVAQRHSHGAHFSPANFDYFLNSSFKLIDEPASAKKDDEPTALLNQYLSMGLQPAPQSAETSAASNTSCDLCQKQFCNKYYLKKHKIDVHGLEPHSAKSNHSIESVQAAATLSMLINPFLLLNNTPAPSTDSASPVKDEPVADEDKAPAIPAPRPDPPLAEEIGAAEPDIACDICGKFFKNADFLSMHKMNKHKLKPLSDLQSNVLSSESFCEYCNKSFCNKYFLRTHMSKAHGKTLIIESGQNSMLDSADDETFFASKVVDRVQCDICQKQVCNKYFLRTHKQKVHGIFDMETTASEENEAGELDMTDERSELQYSMIEENSEMTMADATNEIVPSPPSTSVSPSATPIVDNQNSFCNICKRKFYSYNFLRHHMNKIHGIKLAKRDTTKDENEQTPDKTDVAVSTPKDSTPKSQLMKKLNRLPLSNSLLNLVNSFKCRLCSKEFKNKPLLKQHVQNLHKIEFADYVAKYVHAEQSNTSLARSILLNNLFNASFSPSKNFKFKNKRADAGRKRKNSGNSVGQSSIESSVSKKSRTSSDNELNDMIKQCKSMYENEGNLQAFMLEKDESEPDENACFMPCLVYLPVKGRINDQISVRIKLKPIKQDKE